MVASGVADFWWTAALPSRTAAARTWVSADARVDVTSLAVLLLTAESADRPAPPAEVRPTRSRASLARLVAKLRWSRAFSTLLPAVASSNRSLARFRPYSASPGSD